MSARFTYDPILGKLRRQDISKTQIIRTNVNLTAINQELEKRKLYVLTIALIFDTYTITSQDEIPGFNTGSTPSGTKNYAVIIANNNSNNQYYGILRIYNTGAKVLYVWEGNTIYKYIGTINTTTGEYEYTKSECSQTIPTEQMASIANGTVPSNSGNGTSGPTPH